MNLNAQLNWKKKKAKDGAKFFLSEQFKSTISIITLTVNGLTTPVKRQRMSNWIKRPDL